MRWVIILIVIVFDPLALTLLLAATKAFEWEHNIDLFNIKKKKDEEPNYKADDGSLTDDQLAQLNAIATEARIIPEPEIPEEPAVDELEDLPFRGKGLAPSMPMTASYQTLIDTPVVEKEVDIEPYGDTTQQLIMHTWKKSNPEETFKKYIDLLNAGEITELPWNHVDHTGSLNLSARDLITLRSRLTADNVIPPMPVGEVRGFGISFPKAVNKGDMFLRVDNLPSQLYKFNGTQWILTNKDLSDGYVYDDAYIDHLIEKISTGEYDPDLLSDVEKERIADKLRNNSSLG